MINRLFLVVCLTVVLAAEAGAGDWETLAPGMDLGIFAAQKPQGQGVVDITILRIDPGFWDFVMVGSSWKKGYQNQTAKEWAEAWGLTAAINAGMFATDYTTHVGYLETRGHVNSRHVNKYMSVAAFDPKRKNLPPFRIFDMDASGVSLKGIRRDYGSVVQNLRLIKRPGENRWPQQKKKWSETALGEDREGRALFIFVRSPMTMHNLNRVLLSLGIGIIAAQHLEGGPEAQLYLSVGGESHEMMGSYETAFRENDGNKAAWPIPNILGVRPKP